MNQQNKHIFYFVFVVIFCFQESLAQTCDEIFPDAASNSVAAGDIDFGSGSSVIDSPDNILDTRDLNDGAGPNTSCDGVSCTESGNLASSSNYNTFPGGSDVNVGWFATVNLTPGDYDDLDMNSFATLNMSPGVYTFDGFFNVGFLSSVQVSSVGSVVIYVNDTVFLNSFAQVNTTGSDRYVFLYARDDISVSSDSNVNSVIYAERDMTLNNGASITGAVTAERVLTLGSASDITFDSSMVSNTDFNGFCTQAVVTVPTAIAEWRLDQNTWGGSSGEVIDSSANGLDGYSVAVGGNHPLREILDPAVAGDPGTCSYGHFDGTSDGHLRIDDPGSGSILDLNTEFAVAVWVYAQSWPGSGLMTIASKDENWEFHLNTSGQVNWWWGGGSRELTSSSTVSTGAWHHVAISFESGNQIIYIDGSVAGTNNSTSAITLNNDPVLIGTDLGFTDRNFDGYLDEVKMYDQALSGAEVAAIIAETHTCPVGAAIDHFVIDVGGGSGSTCVPTEVTITAEDSLNNTVTGYTGTLTLSTSTSNGDWANTATPSDALGSLTPGASDSGGASYVFEASGLDLGVVAFDLSNTHAETLTITVSESSNSVVTTSSSIAFSENAFVVSSSDSLGDDLIALRSHDFQIEMYRRDASTGDCSVATNYNVSDVKAWLTRSAADPGGTGPELTNSGSSDTETMANAEPASANFTLPFINGVADFTLLASDVGAYAINFLDDTNSFSDQDISGSSASLVARPFGFNISVSANPGATDESGSVFTTAGSDFSASVTAIGWSSTDDANDDGIPDGHDDGDPSNNADLSNNSSMQSFGAESPVESIVLSSALVDPGLGTDPGLANSLTLPSDGRVLSSFSSGTASTSNVYFAEVGIIEITATFNDGDYLGAGSSFSSRASSRSSYVGRFTPSYFSAAANTLSETCTSGLDYSYMGEAFSLSWQLQALNTLGAITTNYEGVYAKLDSGSGALSFGAIDAAAPTPLSSRLTHNSSSFSWSAGIGTINSSVSLERSSSPDGPYMQVDLGVSAADADGVAIPSSSFNLDSDNDSSDDLINLGQTELRFGRLRLDDAFGPETANIPVIFQTEYWSTNAWVQNLDDSCSAIALSAITYPDGSIDTAANRTATVGGGTSTGTYNSLAGSAVNFTLGDAGHYFTASGGGNTGTVQVDIDLTLYPWLSFDWDQDGDYSDSSLPAANFTFGAYRGHDRIIFWQEIFQ